MYGQIDRYHGDTAGDTEGESLIPYGLRKDFFLAIVLIMTYTIKRQLNNTRLSCYNITQTLVSDCMLNDNCNSK